MSSVSSANLGLAYLTQLLSSTGSPLASSNVSSQVQSALANAPAADIVQISNQALQLQGLDTLFGIPGSSSTAPDSSTMLSQILSTLGGNSNSSSAGNSITSSLSYQVSNYENQLQGEELQSLTGSTSTFL